MNPVSLEPDKVYAYDLGIIPKGLTYTNTSSNADGNFLKYRYKELGKTDIQIGYKKYSLGISMRYNSHMQNIDKIFIDPFFATQVPGIERANAQNSLGDFIWDLRFGYEFNKHFKLNAIINNVFNHEMMTRPTDIRPPRLIMMQMNYRF
jgi:outer membrane cobalamin receptor